MGDPRMLKVMAKLAQRAQRQCTGYYCGYTFKGQPVGAKYLRLASRSLNYLQDTMEKKTPAQRYHRATHRALLDLEHRCLRRTAAEEWNLATNVDEQDRTAAEFVRTFRSSEFNGRALLAKHESEKKKESVAVKKVVPEMKEELDEETEVWLQHFPDLYGYRGKNDKNAGVHLLSPWEFLCYWECRKLPRPKKKRCGERCS